MTRDRRRRDEAPEGQAEGGFEGQLAALQESLRRLEQGDLSLDESLSEYERGLKMLQGCYHTLEQAERKIELLARRDDGSSSLQAFEHEAWRGPDKPD